MLGLGLSKQGSKSTQDSHNANHNPNMSLSQIMDHDWSLRSFRFRQLRVCKLLCSACALLCLRLRLRLRLARLFAATPTFVFFPRPAAWSFVAASSPSCFTGSTRSFPKLNLLVTSIVSFEPYSIASSARANAVLMFHSKSNSIPLTTARSPLPMNTAVSRSARACSISAVGSCTVSSEMRTSPSAQIDYLRPALLRTRIPLRKLAVLLRLCQV